MTGLRLPSSAPIIVTAVLALALMVGVASSSTLAADDFVRGGNLARLGLGGSIAYEYGNWDGRFSAFTLEYLLAPFIRNRHAYSFVLGAVLATSIVAVAAAIFRLTRNLRWSALCAVSVFAALIVNSRDLADALFWLTGGIENILPVALGAYVLARVIEFSDQEHAPHSAAVAGLGLLTALICGFHELYGVALLALVLVVIAPAIYRERRAESWMIVIAGAAALALAAVVFAPGNAVRSAHYVDLAPRRLALARHAVVQSIKAMVEVLTSSQTLLGLALVVAGGGVVRQRSAEDRLALVASAAFCFGLVGVLLFIPTALVGYLPPRTHDALTLLFLLLLLYWASRLAGAMTEPMFRTERIRTTVFTVLAIGWMLTFLASPITRAMAVAAVRSAKFERAVADRHAFLMSLRRRADTSVELAPLPAPAKVTFREDITSDPGVWINQGLARYYGVGEVYLGERNSVRFGKVAKPPPTIEMLVP